MDKLDHLFFEKLIETPKILFVKLAELKHSDRGVYDFKNLFIELNKNQRIDICQIAAEAIDNGVSIFPVIALILDAFPFFKS